jgi:3-hydroxyisobutyrate dehydrogenase|tara:strand:+ start:4136 stop:5065 length:930 start_codon:yes stop_codon:yes gene_type:complete
MSQIYQEEHKMDVKKETIGFIGLGIMGLPMAKNLIKSNFDLIVYNRTKSKTKELSELGARVASNPKEVAENAKCIITMLTDSPDVEQIILGENGVIKGIQANSIVIDMSTISPKITRNINEELSKHQSSLLDAPVSGGSWGAIEGTLSIMIGGSNEDFNTCLPVFEAMGKNIIHTGSSGMGQTTKLVNQILVAGTMNAVAEAMVFAAKSGADLSTTIEAVGGGAAASWQLNTLGPRLIKGDFDPGFMIKLQQKDLRLIIESAQELNVAIPGTSLVSQLFAGLLSQGLGDEGTQALVKAHEQLSNVKARI